MKKIAAFVMAGIVAMSCQEDTYVKRDLPPTILSGLNLTFIETRIPLSSSVWFTNETTGLISTLTGAIHRTTNAGQTWVEVFPASDNPIYDFYFADELHGFAVGGNSNCTGTGCVPKGATMIKTNDGGVTWEPVSFTMTNKTALSAIEFSTASTGFAAGYNTILRTQDGGLTWSETIIENSGSIIRDIKFTDGANGIAVFQSGKIARTSNGGGAWALIPETTLDPVNAVALSRDGGIVVGGEDMFTSSDVGSNWTLVNNSPQDVFSIVYVSPTLGFAFGRGIYSGGDFGYHYGSIFITKSGKENWTGTMDVHEMGQIKAAFFPTSKVGYAVSVDKLMKIDVK